MSLNDILNSAASGLAASQAGMATASNNIANVNTPGYARQKTVVSTGTSAGRTTGVVVGEPERVADRFLESTVYRRTGDAGQAEVTSKYLDQLQSLLGAPRGNVDNTSSAPPLGLPSELDDLLAQAIKLTGALEPDQTSNSFINSAKNVLSSFSQLNSDIDNLRGNTASEIGSTVGQINDLLKRIDGLNDSIAQSQALGRSTSGSADERMSALQELSGLINVHIQDQPDGRVTIETAEGQTLLDTRPRQLSYPASATGTNTVYRRTGDAGQAEVTSKYLDQLQSLLGAPRGNVDNTSSAPPLGLPAELDDLLAQAIKLTGALEPDQTSNSFINSAKNVLSSFSQLNSDIDNLRGNTASEIGSTVGQINDLLKRIDGLNDSIAQSQALGRSTSGSADERMSALQELSGLINVHIQDQPDGRVTIETAEGQTLLDTRPRQLSYPAGATGTNTTYPPIEIRFVDDKGNPGASTGQTLEGGTVGGTLGGLLQLRDETLPGYQDRIGAAFDGLARALNKAANEGTTVPAPPSLTGRPTGLMGDDRAGFTGKATFAVTGPDGTVLARSDIDFADFATPPNDSIQDVLDQINADLGGAATASLGADGTLSFTAADSKNGVVVAQDPASPSSRGGVGFSQFFGLNDMIRSDTSPLVPPGFAADDETSFGTGETAQIVLRDPTGRELASYTLTGAAGQTFGDVVAGLNASPLSGFGSFALTDTGEIRFTPTQAASGVSLSIPVDSTNRKGTGLSFSQLSGLTGDASGVDTGHVRPDITGKASNLPLARFQFGAAIGEKGLGAGDMSGATDFIDALNTPMDFGASGKSTVSNFTNALFGDIGADANQAVGSMTDSTARRDDAISRRDTFSGVNVDEELANMVVLQNSYSAAARVLTTASDMYDTLLNMVK